MWRRRCKCEQKMNVCLTGDCIQQTKFHVLWILLTDWHAETSASQQHWTLKHVRRHWKHWNMKTITQYQTCKRAKHKAIAWASSINRLVQSTVGKLHVPESIYHLVHCVWYSVACAVLTRFNSNNTHQWMILFSTNTIANVRILCFVRCSVGGAWRMEPTHRQNTHSTSEIFLEAYSTVRLSTAVL